MHNFICPHHQPVFQFMSWVDWRFAISIEASWEKSDNEPCICDFLPQTSNQPCSNLALSLGHMEYGGTRFLDSGLMSREIPKNVRFSRRLCNGS